MQHDTQDACPSIRALVNIQLARLHAWCQADLQIQSTAETLPVACELSQLQTIPAGYELPRGSASHPNLHALSLYDNGCAIIVLEYKVVPQGLVMVRCL